MCKDLSNEIPFCTLILLIDITCSHYAGWKKLYALAIRAKKLYFALARIAEAKAQCIFRS